MKVKGDKLERKLFGLVCFIISEYVIRRSWKCQCERESELWELIILSLLFLLLSIFVFIAARRQLLSVVF